MVGLLFIVNVPQKEYEESMRLKSPLKLIIEKEKFDKASEIARELKENKKYSSLVTSVGFEDQNISKCKSTDCLHKDDKLTGLYKSKSENTLSDSIDSKHSSFDEVKQIIKSKKNKLQITRPVRGIDILGAFHWDTPLETILSEIIESLNIFNATWNATRDNHFWKVMFSLESGNLCEELLQVLRTFGIGSRHQSSVSVIPCSLYYKSSPNDSQTEKEKIWESETHTGWTRFMSSVRARTNLAQVLHQVRADAALTFDWIFLLVVAAFVAAIGLVENSTVVLVASMLISPLMGPITAGTLGTAVKDRSLQHMGFMHETLGLFLSLVIGFIFGLAICAVDERYGVGDWPTYEMMTRCEIRSLWVGVLIAIPSGAGVALAVLGDYTASLVGVAISASLLPPAVNAGLLWAMALVHLIYADDETRWTQVVTTANFSSDNAAELAVLGSISLCLTLINIVCIYVAGYVVYKVKEVYPLERRDISWWRANKKRLQSSVNRKHDGGWDNYSKWSNEPDEIKQEMVKKESPAVHGDTVTYRRHHIGGRPKAQHIEDYCYQTPHDLIGPLNADPSKINAEGQNKSKPEKNISWKDANSNEQRYGPDSFYNIGFENDVDDNDNSHPVIEPSSNHTVDARHYAVALEKKSFHV
ncbi:uncharacterized protein LOC128673191 [Plodia interpunctella]|uniref:uncharacterized protein LOC128673191 n=1 Tax=Plodia interpunctella TaxID=58824 RepID=UPI002368E80B|nr:uncharacterized protein LOC128673191 [Plodia interpunctella]